MRKIPQKPEVEPPVLDQEISVYKAKEYSNLRSKFLTAAREERGLSNQEAADEWNQSSLKRKLLGSLSVSELRRRRFIEKGCHVNPWADAATS